MMTKTVSRNTETTTPGAIPNTVRHAAPFVTFVLSW
jgi:hypothetical protein